MSMGEYSTDFHGTIEDFTAHGYDVQHEFIREDDRMIIKAPFVKSDKPVVYRMRLK